METMLKVEEVSFSYNGKLILRDIHLKVHAGEVLAVVGPNGAGKTTLIRTISGVLSPQKGLIQVAGINLARLNPTQRARYLAVVPQARELPSTFTVFQTVMLGRTPYLGWLGNASAKDEQIVWRVLRSTQLEELAERRIGELSGGEQQRVLLARALAQSTPLLLLDEPTAHLDLQHQSHLLNLVRQTADECGLAVLLAIHDLNLVGLYADRVLLLVDGAVQSVGTPSEVLTKTNIERAYQVSVEVITHPKYGTPLIIPDDNGQASKDWSIPAAVENLTSTQEDHFAEAMFSSQRVFLAKNYSPLYSDERFGVKGKRG